ncbi:MULTISPECIES: hypothetical protein [Gammaproteobacteria]|uniref:hypothetical protein n=1 Tax=Gammaproteobacteria TaxID=1236 RepID=UPI00404849A4
MLDAILGAYSAHQYNKSQEQIAAEANAASAASVAAQMDFQREMSNTSYQRSVADMRAAGINPMLAAMRGGASTPGGASYTAQMPNLKDIGASAIQAFQGSSSARESLARIEQVDASVDKIKEEIKNIPLEGDRIKQAAYMLYQQAELMIAQKFNQSVITDQLRATIKKLDEETGLLKNQAAAEAALGNLAREVKQLQPIIDILKPFIRR